MKSLILLVVLFPQGESLLAPIATGPSKVLTAYFVNVDIIVVNRVRTSSTTYGPWGRPKITPHERVWISFWDYSVVPWIPTNKMLIGRGWWTMSQVQNLSRCQTGDSIGWLLESKDGTNVIAPEILLIDSDYDWEMRNRHIFRPIRKP